MNINGSYDYGAAYGERRSPTIPRDLVRRHPRHQPHAARPRHLAGRAL
jgi:hypothetical protein